VYAEHQGEIDAFHAEINQLNEQLADVNRQAADLQERMKLQWQAMGEKLRERQPEPEIECPDFDGDEDLDPLFDSTRDYVDQIDSYKIYQDRPTKRRARTPRPRRPAPRPRIVETSTLEPADEPPPRPLMRRGNEPPAPAPRQPLRRGN
jgi:hypothetical protein